MMFNFNCIGAFEVPDWKNIPEIDILLETRKGAAQSYSTEQRADKHKCPCEILKSHKSIRIGAAEGT